jgi:predicted DNA-binding protein (MmcQ/YjbR family)
VDKKTAALKAMLDAMPGATADGYTPPRAAEPLVLMYKIAGKMFAILAVRGAPNVIVKCDPDLAHLLREQYQGVGHRSHLDKRFWISVDLDADVPAKEIKRLVEGSYALIRASLTKKQQAELAAIGGSKI